MSNIVLGVLGVLVGSILTFFINWVILRRGKRLEAYGNINRNLVKFHDTLNKFVRLYGKKIKNINDRKTDKEYVQMKNSLSELNMEVLSNFYIIFIVKIKFNQRLYLQGIITY